MPGSKWFARIISELIIACKTNGFDRPFVA